MHAFTTVASLALLLATCVRAGIYVTNPVQSTSCAGGQSCGVEWIDDGQAPLLNQIGECSVGVYTGEDQLVQSLPSVDVSTASSFTFTVNPSAGVNGVYYIKFTSISDAGYSSWSGSFSLTGMTGSTPSSGSSTPSTTPTESTTPSGATTPSGTATSVSGTDTTQTTPTSVPGSTLTPSSVVSLASSATSTTHTTASTTTTSSTSAATSATASSAAARVGSSTSVGGIAALLVLSGVLAF